MKLSTITTAAIVAVLASSQGAAAVDFDFRAFEGWWETPDAVTDVSDPTIGIDTYGLSGANINTLFACGATGDFRKAICNSTSVTQDEEACTLAGQPGHVQAVQKCKFMLDQLDADTGVVDGLMCDVQCCGSSGCSDYPWEGLTALYNTFNPNNPIGVAGAFGPQVNVKFALLPGKSNNHVRAIQVTQGPMYSSYAKSKFSKDDPKPFTKTFQLRKLAGGFKEE